MNDSLILPSPDRLHVDFCRSGFVLLNAALESAYVRNMQQRAYELVEQTAIHIRRESDGQLLSYAVVTGDVVRQHFPELLAFYTDPALRDWIRQVTGAADIFLSRNLRSAVNINCLRERGQIYRWHYDAIPYTLILFLTTSAPEDGGAFEIAVSKNSGPNRRIPERPDFSILPRSGNVLLMDGTRCLHRAAPLLVEHQRLTVPMVFPAIPDDSRPEGLDDYLYESSSKDQKRSNEK